MKAWRVSFHHPPLLLTIREVIKAEDKTLFSFGEAVLVCLDSAHPSLSHFGYNCSGLGTGQSFLIQYPPATLTNTFGSLTGFPASLLPFKEFLAHFSNFSVHHNHPEFVKQALAGLQLQSF